jgi:ABC-2 type transport system ATP-binding protein
VALVGPNGAGKTTFLRLSVGLDGPTAGHIEVLGWSPQDQPTLVLPRIGFVAQDRPLYGRFKVKDLLELGRRLNPRWDGEQAQARMKRLGIPLERPAGQLSGGQRAQVALTMVLAKRPDLLLLDEPVAGLDPLARREFLQDLMEAVADKGLSVVLSSHIVSELERTCDYLVILAEGQVQVAGEIDALVNQHRVLVGPRATGEFENDPTVIRFSHTERVTTLLVRTDGCGIGSEWEVNQVSLEDIVLAYLSRPTARFMPRPELVDTEIEGRT